MQIHSQLDANPKDKLEVKFFLCFILTICFIWLPVDSLRAEIPATKYYEALKPDGTTEGYYTSFPYAFSISVDNFNSTIPYPPPQQLIESCQAITLYSVVRLDSDNIFSTWAVGHIRAWTYPASCNNHATLEVGGALSLRKLYKCTGDDFYLSNPYSCPDPLPLLNPKGAPGESCPATGNPISIGYGNKFLKEVDYIGGRLTDLSQNRTYNATTIVYQASSGLNWRFKQESSIQDIGQEAYTFRSNGRVFTYTNPTGTL
ncbi:MAG: hypothetical protein CTY12_07690, partial [Methylotenera sp.]